MFVWRVGYYSAPCDFPPSNRPYAWTNRFDDPNKQYRTLYCADEKKTCLREVLADFRPNTKAILEFIQFFKPTMEEKRVFGKVTMGWRREHVLAQANMKISSGKIVDVEDTSVLKKLEYQMADFLARESIKHIDIKELRSKRRNVTQQISRALFDSGYDVIKFYSHLDRLPCYALFEFRAKLNQIGKAISLAVDFPELIVVCKELDLVLG